MNPYLSGGLLAALFSVSAWAYDATARQASLKNENAGVSNERSVTSPVALDRIVVTRELMSDPYRISSNPRQPHLPLPAHDGGSYLQSIPGFSLSRKGGTSGDPELRGLGGSRLNLLLDDSMILGGCGGRMDPPTAYIYPEAHDRIEVIKGPQSVRYGASTAGVVRFERDTPQFQAPGISGYTSATAGGFGRRDATGEVLAGAKTGYARVTGTWSTQDDYRDGNGQAVHSQYERWSAGAVIGWTPDDRTVVEMRIDRSDGEAAYDDRKMDGVRFDRTGYGLSIERSDLGPRWRELELMIYYNYVDHVMDNFTLREPPKMPMISYPDRRTRGGRLTAEFLAAEDVVVNVGIDWVDNRNANNSLGGPEVKRFGNVPREGNADFIDVGAFVEMSRMVSTQGRFTFGLRADHSEVEALASGGFGGVAQGTEDREEQLSGFMRYSHQLEHKPVMLYAGLGRAERAPDFWERRRVFDLDNEVLTQADFGARYEGDRMTGTLGLFYGQFDDFILIAAPNIATEEARNIEATTYGAEADLRYRINDHLSVVGTLSWVRSDNDSDDVPLAQTPPMESTLGVDYDDRRWFGGALFQAVARQDRIHTGHGTIYSLDTTPTPGFAVMSVYAGYRIGERWTLTGGIDNLFDRHHAEHIQRGFAELGALDSRIPEPGRTAWMRLNGNF